MSDDILNQDDMDALFDMMDSDDSSGGEQDTPAEKPAPSGGVMSQDDLDDLLGDLDEEPEEESSSPEAEAAESSPQTPPDQPPSSGGVMSQDDLDDLLGDLDEEPEEEASSSEAEAAEAATHTPAEKPAPSGGVMSQDDLDDLLGDLDEEPKEEASSPEAEAAEAAPHTPAEQPAPSGGVMSQDDLDDLLGDLDEEPERESLQSIENKNKDVKEEPLISQESPAEEKRIIEDSNDILDLDELESLVSGAPSGSAQKNEAAAPESKVIESSDDILDLDELANLIGEPAEKRAVVEKKETAHLKKDIMEQDEVDKIMSKAAIIKTESPPTKKVEDKKSEKVKKKDKKTDEGSAGLSPPKVMSQDEIDNLFENLDVDDIKAGAVQSEISQDDGSQGEAAASFSKIYQEARSEIESKPYKLYNFRRPEKLSRNQIRSMKPPFEAMTRSITNYMSMQLKTSAEVNLLDIDQINYGDIFKKHDYSEIVAIFKINPTNYSGIMEFSTHLFYCIEERMMGGSGKSHIPVRKITEFERYLVTDILNRFLENCSDILKKFTDVDPRIELVETDKYLIPRTSSDEEVLVRLIFELGILGVSGLLKISMPYNFISPFFSNYNLSVDKVSGIKEELSKTIVKSNYSKISVPISVELRSKNLSIQELLAIKEGDVLVLEHPNHEDLELKVDDIPKFLCKPGISGNKLAVKITGFAEREV